MGWLVDRLIKAGEMTEKELQASEIGVDEGIEEEADAGWGHNGD